MHGTALSHPCGCTGVGAHCGAFAHVLPRARYRPWVFSVPGRCERRLERRLPRDRERDCWTSRLRSRAAARRLGATPAVFVQFLPEPSPSMRFPSSHSSFGSRTPLPHTRSSSSIEADGAGAIIDRRHHARDGAGVIDAERERGTFARVAAVEARPRRW